MPREKILQAFILKKQDYGETDQIVTLFSKEEGKVRGLVKAAKLPTSKLQPVLQPLFETSVTIARSTAAVSLIKIIRAQAIFTYSGILDDANKLSAWYMAVELLLRSLPDGEPNDSLYADFQRYALFLHETALTPEQIKLSIAQFQIKTLNCIGLGIRTIKESPTKSVWFSLDAGGFSLEDSTADSRPVTLANYQMFTTLSTGSAQYQEIFPFTSTSMSDEEIKNINNFQQLINRFVSYQLEREIKTQRHLVI